MKTFDQWFYDYQIKHGLKGPIKDIAEAAWQAALPNLNHWVEDQVVLALVEAVKPFLQIEEQATYSLGQITASDITTLHKAYEICVGHLGRITPPLNDDSSLDCSDYPR